MIVLTVFAALVAIGCAAACTTRLWFATHPIAFHPAVWLSYVEQGKADAVEQAIASDAKATWEREFGAALAEPNPEARAGKVNEQLSELDFRLGRWDRVPRVCASIASSAGLLFGSLVLRVGLTMAEGDGSDAINAVVFQAINVVALGVAGATFAIAAQYRSRKAAKAFQRDADALVDALERKMIPSTSRNFPPTLASKVSEGVSSR